MILPCEEFRRCFDANDKDTLERLLQSLFKRCNQVLKLLVGDDFEAEHTGIRKRHRQGKLATFDKIGPDVFDAAVRWWIEGEEEGDG